MTIQKIGMMILIGLCTGVFSGLFGVGGGVIIVPVLVLLLGYSQISATSTSLVALLLPVGLLGVIEYYRSGKLTPDDIKLGLLIAVGLFFGVLVGAKVALNIPDQMLRKGFSVFLLFIAARLWWL